ncbi:hypothetical protein [Pseudomonas asplenii]|uniref:hypothetical protein n=1 Tax=Pseudomonas asplenii TaxID=53407 RepID=UPI0009B7DD36|nr:hypothetical protein [Pseudomonas fuscovaginae]
MSTKKPPHPMKASELERFECNLANWLKLDSVDATYHRFQGMLEGQIVTLQSCGVISPQAAVRLHARMSEAMREKSTTNASRETEKPENRQGSAL